MASSSGLPARYIIKTVNVSARPRKTGNFRGTDFARGPGIENGLSLSKLKDGLWPPLFCCILVTIPADVESARRVSARWRRWPPSVSPCGTAPHPPAPARLSAPVQVAVDAEERVYVLEDKEGGRISIYSHVGEFLQRLTPEQFKGYAERTPRFSAIAVDR